MAYKLGFLLSLFFVVQVLCYVGDLSAIQAISSLLDATALTAGNRIALEGGLQEDVIQFVKDEAGATIVPLSSSAKVGEIYSFRITRSYSSLVLSKEPTTISVTRSAVIGYLG
jgi:hypothetical protein